MNVFQQTSTPNLLYFPSYSSASSCHGRRRISPHNPPLLVSFPATKMKFNPKSLHLVHGIQHSSSKPLLASPPTTMGFNPKSLHLINGIRHSPATMELAPQCLHYLPCHGIKHSFCEPVLASPATMKCRPVLFALPRDNEELPSDNEQEQSNSIVSDNVHEEQPKKFVVREATTMEEFRAAALLKAEVFYEDRSHDSTLYEIQKHAKKELHIMLNLHKMRALAPYMCIVAVRKDDENVIGTLDFYVETNPKYYLGISDVSVTKSARRQGVGSRMLKFVIDYAKENGIPLIELYVERDNKQAVGLYSKMGFTILAVDNYQYRCSLNL